MKIRYCILEIRTDKIMGFSVYLYNYSGRKDGTPRGIPNNRMLMKKYVKKVDMSVFPFTANAIQMFVSSGGSLTAHSSFGVDPFTSSNLDYNPFVHLLS